MHFRPNMNFHQNPLRSAASEAALALALLPAALLAGCSSSLPSNFGVTTTPSGSIHISGVVMGGQQPVASATIQLYTVGTAGLASASSPILYNGSTLGSTTSDTNGNFTITGKYNCTGTAPETTAATQVYITATGGNPGAGTNSAINMVAALGSCATLLANANTTFISLNEVTTVAAAYSLAPFATDYTHVGATGASPTGLVNAFGNAALLANTGSGTSPGANLGAGVSVPYTEVNTLANILAACVNTTGPASTQCSTLFTATGATDTFGAALAIAKSPGAAAVTGLYSLSSSTAPFQPSMTSQPNDYTIAVSTTANGTFNGPDVIAFDSFGNAWITNETGTTVTELKNSTALAATVSPAGLSGPQGIAVDRSNNVWVANSAGNSAIKITTSNGAPVSNASYTAGGINAPVSVAIDSAGNAFFANFNGNSVTGLTTAGAALAGSPFTGSGNITSPSSLALDTAGNLFVASSNGTAVKLTNAGAYTSSDTDNALQGSITIALDGSNRVFLAGFVSGTAVTPAYNLFSTAGAPVAASPTTLGNALDGVASDGTYFWAVNTSAGSGSLFKYAYGATVPNVPANGFGSLVYPLGVAIDSSGSVWTTNGGTNTVSKFIGLANAVTSPIAANVGP